MKRWWGVFVVAVVVLATACSNMPTREKTGEIRLRLLMADDWAGTVPVDAALRAFETAHPGVRVEIDGLPFGDIPEAIASATQSGAPYDLAQWHAFAAGARGLSQPLGDLWERDLDPGDFLPGAVQDVQWGGQVHGVPLDVNALILMANRDQLDAAGVDDPQLATFKGLSEAALALGMGVPGQRGFALGLSSWAAYGWIRANGGEVVDIASDGTPTFRFVSPETVAAMEFLQQLVGSGAAHAPGALGSALGTKELFNGGDVGLIATGSWDLVSASQRARADDLDAPNAVALPMPVGPLAGGPGSALGGSSLFVPVGSMHRALAFDLALALIEDDIALAMAQQEGRLPARRRVYDAPFFDDPTMQVLRAHLEFASPMRLIAFPDASFAFSQALERILVRGESVVAVLQAAQDKAEASWAASQ